MKKRILAMTLVMLLALSVLATGCPPAEPVGPVEPVTVPPIRIEWNFQTWYPAGTLGYATFVAWTERVYELTDGRLLITPHPGGAIVPTFKGLDAIVAGTLDGAQKTPVAWAGRDAGFGVATFLPFGLTENWQYDVWLHELGGAEMIRELYAAHGLHLIGNTLWGPESLVSTAPIHRVEDMKGLRMRSPGGILAAIFARFGASLVVMPLGEVPMALEKGIIEVADWGTPHDNHVVGLHKLARYFVHPFPHVNPIMCISVRLDTWNELPADIQAILETSIRELFWEHASEQFLKDRVAVEAMIAAGNVALDWDEAEVARMTAIAIEVWKEWAAKTPAAYRIVTSKMNFMRELGIIE